MRVRTARIKTALFVLILTLLQMFPIFPVKADDEELWSYYDYGDGVIAVTLTDKTVETAEVPEKIDGKTVTMIEVDCFNGCENLKSVKIPESVTVIEDYSFYHCKNLESITIPKNVKNIGFQAFCGCFKLEEVTIPASVNEIEAFAFEGCNSMKAFHVAKENQYYKDEDGILFDIEGKTLIVYPSAKEGTSYTVPDGCTRVDDYAFMGCTHLESINIDNITELGEDAFYYCTSLKNIRVPDTITKFEGSVFGNCSSLESIQMPAKLESIGSGCFYSCFMLKEIEIPETVTAIFDNAFFNCASLKTIHLTKNVTEIGNYALGYCYTDGAEDGDPIRLPDFVVDAEDNTVAFAYCVTNEIKCTGGVTQGTVFIYIIVGVIALAIIATVALIIVQKRIQKRYELN